MFSQCFHPPMTASLASALKVLLKKNIKLKLRSKMSLFCELVLPLFAIAVIIGVLFIVTVNEVSSTQEKEVRINDSLKI